MKAVGKKLQQRREELDHSLSDVSLSTKISVRVLEAIEQGNKSLMPPLPYFKGFVRTYSKYLKLDSNEIIELLNQELVAEELDLFLENPHEFSPQEAKPQSDVEAHAKQSLKKQSQKGAHPQGTQGPSVEQVDQPDQRALPNDFSQGSLGRHLLVLGVFMVLIIFFGVGVTKWLDMRGGQGSVDQVSLSQPSLRKPSAKSTDSALQNLEGSKKFTGANEGLKSKKSRHKEKEVGAHNREPRRTISKASALPPVPPAPSSLPTPSKASSLPVPPAPSLPTPSKASLPPPVPPPSAPSRARLPVESSTQATISSSSSRSHQNRDKAEKNKDKPDTKVKVTQMGDGLAPSSSSANLRKARVQEVIVEALDNVDVQFKFSSQSFKSIHLKSKQIHTFKFSKKMTFLFSNGHGVRVFLNGKAYKVPGASRQSTMLQVP